MKVIIYNAFLQLSDKTKHIRPSQIIWLSFQIANNFQKNTISELDILSFYLGLRNFFYAPYLMKMLQIGR